MRVVVTGGAGFIGSNLVRGLNAMGIDDVLVVDDLTDGQKFANLTDLRISDYVDRRDFYDAFAAGRYGTVEAVLHQGACSDTMEHDGRLMMELNYSDSRRLLDRCEATGTRLLYASSAAVYGGGSVFVEDQQYERPLNVYGYSKKLFDDVVRIRAQRFPQVAGFRYFNVYGPGEAHKGRMASVAFHHFKQWQESGRVRLFGGFDGWGPGEQSRDFIYVSDLVDVVLWFFQNPDRGGIYNLGTGRAEAFNAVANAVVNAMRRHASDEPLSLAEQVSQGLVEYVDFPDALKHKYQSFTQADMTRLADAGYRGQFTTVADGVSRYIDALVAGRGS